ncbi:MAG: hemolysin family protein [Myxococcales bacterium]
MLQILVDNLLLVGLLLLKGFFSGSEIALVNADRLHLQHLAREGDRGAGLALRMLERPEVLLTTTLIGTNISTVSLVTIGTAMIIRAAGEGGDLYAFAVLTPLLLILGEIVPKSVYQQNADRLAPRIIFPLWSLSLLLAPVTLLFSASARTLARLIGSPIERAPVLASKHMIRAVVRTSDRAKGVDIFDRHRIQRAMRFSDLMVSEVMVPLSEVSRVAAAATLADALEVVHGTGVYTLIVHGAATDDVVGVLALSPWEVAEGLPLEEPVEQRMRTPLFVPESKPASALADALHRQPGGVAVVVGERGAAMGVVTLEGIYAEVTGPMDSGFRLGPHADPELTAVEELDEDELLIGGRVPVQTLVELLEYELPAHAGRTVGGLMLRELSKVPAEGDRVRIGEFTLTVVEASAREVRKVRVVRGQGGPETPDAR